MLDHVILQCNGTIDIQCRRCIWYITHIKHFIMLNTRINTVLCKGNVLLLFTVHHSAGSRPSCSPGPTPAYTGGCGVVSVSAGLHCSVW